MIGKLYNKYYKKSIINRTLITFLVITVLSLFILTQIMLTSFGKILEEKELSLNSKALDRVSSFVDQKYRVAVRLYQRIYLDEYNDQIRPADFFEKYPEMTTEEETKSKLSLEGYLISSFQLDPDIFDILLKREKEDSCYINESSAPVLRELSALPPEFDLKQLAAAKGFSLLPAHDTAYARSRRKAFTMGANIVSTYYPQKTGSLFIEYDVNSILNSYVEYKKDIKGYILILTGAGEVVYDSSGRYYGQKYPYYKSLQEGRRNVVLDEASIINVIHTNVSGIVIAGIIPRREILSSINSIKRTFYLISFLFILVSVILAYLSTTRISRRVRIITDAMRHLRRGDLSKRIPVGDSEDELSDIAVSFNHMCSDLENYINKVYLSEIRQKTAELNALQSQINPHFLYNTLESIRMRAIKQGDSDAGEMIYLLAVLFRSTIREEMFIYVEDEIKYCKLYLELFKIRYEDRLKVSISIDENIKGSGIIKHLLQPVIENYIVHGFDAEREDNHISITGRKNGGDLVFKIEDNAKGIDIHKLDEIRASLSENPPAANNIGLPNVNERIRLIYGTKYGLEIDSSPGNGTIVTLTIRDRTKKELKEYVQNTYRG